MAAETRDELRQTIDTLEDEQVPAVLAFVRLVQSGRVDVRVSAAARTDDETASPGPLFSKEDMEDDPMLRVLASASEDDEPLSDDEAASVAQGLAEYGRGDYVSANVAKTLHLR